VNEEAILLLFKRVGVVVIGGWFLPLVVDDGRKDGGDGGGDNGDGGDDDGDGEEVRSITQTIHGAQRSLCRGTWLRTLANSCYAFKMSSTS